MVIYRDVVWPEAEPHPTLKHGRKIEHDSRSLNYAAPEWLDSTWWQCLTGRKPKPKTVLWAPEIPPLDQGNLGSCTGNAETHLLATPAPGYNPLDYVTGWGALNEGLARYIYGQATLIDGFAGKWPPTDTGSSGLAVMKVAKRLGFIKGYKHALSINGVITALQTGPAITGIAWRQGMYEPNPKGFVSYAGPVVGGHEFEVIGYDVDSQYFTFRNSWGPAWGDNGNFHMYKWDFAAALKDHGDVTIPVYA